jgi:polyhydroxybutyrate depolymerase
MPVVVMLHGAGSSGRRAMRNTSWHKAADQHGFIALFPDAMRPAPERRSNFLSNPQLWNDGSGRGGSSRGNVDDVAFIAAMLDDVASRHSIDHRRVYVTGFSNGASMAFRVGTHLSDRIAAIAPVAGVFCDDGARPDRPVSLLFIVGTKDPLVPLAGGHVRFPWGATDYQPPVLDSLRAWVETLKCPTVARRTIGSDGIDVERFGPCRGGTEVLFYVVHDQGHAWPGGRAQSPPSMIGPTAGRLCATDAIWEFFSGHVRL